MFARNLLPAFSLDVTTLVVVAIFVVNLLGLLLLFVWIQERIRALAWWGAAYLTGGFSAALWCVGGPHLPPWLPGALLLAACAMMWSAARLFHGRDVVWPAMLLGAAAWAVSSSLPAFAQSAMPRAMLASLTVFAYAVLAAGEFWRERRKSLLGRWPVVLVPVLHGALFLFPLMLASQLPDQPGDMAPVGGWLALLVLGIILYAVGTAFVVLVLAKERMLRAHRTAALTDSMTGLYNRRGFLDGAGRLLSAQVRRRQPVSLLLIDLDCFKSINDRFGHAVGDEALRLFASVASANMRANDLVARMGGDEFVAVVPDGADEAVNIAERIRAAYETAASVVSGQPVGATVSIGIASQERGGDIDTLLARADEALYAVKKTGRNRVATAGSSNPGGVDVAPTAAARSVRWTAFRRPQLPLRQAA